MNRANSVLGHFKNNSIHGKKTDDDIVITSAVRTAICKSKKGSFNQTSPVALLTPLFKKILETGIDPNSIQEIVIGTVMAPGSFRHVECRMAGFLAGFPNTTTVKTVNRQCSSGLQAIADVASAIKSGYYRIGIAAGVESMTLDARFQWYAPIFDDVTKNKQARDCMIPMGITSENVAQKFNISRLDQDKIAFRSHKRAFAARNKFKEEIVPVKTVFKDPKTGKMRQKVVDLDEGVRENGSLEDLNRLKPAFVKSGTTTAGNSSQVSDGAAAVLVMERRTAMSLGLEILGVFKSFAVKGCPPEIMGIGPVYAIPEAVKKAGYILDQIEIFEINEAFASQCGYCVQKLGLSWDNVNVNGGAIALGHPLGCTGARMVTTLLHEMKRSHKKRGVVSMCIGTGMGAAAVFERD